MENEDVIYLSRSAVCVVGFYGLSYREVTPDLIVSLRDIESKIKTKFIEIGKFSYGPPVPIKINYDEMHLMDDFLSLLCSQNSQSKHKKALGAAHHWHKSKYSNKCPEEIAICNTIIEKDIFVAIKDRSLSISLATIEKSSHLLSQNLAGFPSEWRPDVSLDWSKHRSNHWGIYDSLKKGSHGLVSLAMQKIITRQGIVVDSHYRDEIHHKWPEIEGLGDFNSMRWTDHVVVNLLDAIAGAACQYYVSLNNNPIYAEKGEGVALILSMLRKEFMQK
jgi:hypothetical protein